MEDLIKAILRLNERVEAINQRIDRLMKRPDLLFREEWMDSLDVQNALHIGIKHLRSLRRSGKLPFTRIQRKIYYKVADVRALLEEKYIAYHYPQQP